MIAVSLERRARPKNPQEQIIKKSWRCFREYKYAKNAARKNVAKSDSVEPDTYAKTS